MKEVDVAILGAGPGGYVAAIRAAQLGASVCVVENREVGGTCLNRGCIPTKAILESVAVLEAASGAGAFGVEVGKVTVDVAKVMARKEQVVSRLRKGVAGLLKKSRVEVVQGTGSLASRTEVAVAKPNGETEKVKAEKIVVATGSDAQKLPVFPFDGESVLTSDDALQLEAVPGSIIIVGAGAVGCEWATIFAGLGAKVAIVEMLEQLLPGLDADVAKELWRAFKKQKIGIHLGATVEKLEAAEQGVAATLADGTELTEEKALICTGRTPLSEGLGLEALEAKTEKGFIKTDEHCMTSVPGIFAIGDVTGESLLAHVASAQGKVAVEYALGKEVAIDYRVVPACIFTHPEIASVGLTEAEAKEQGVEVTVSSFPFQAIGKALAIGHTAGFAKLVADASTGELLGAHIVGASATDLIAEMGLALKMEATVEEVANTIHAHPTLAEIWMEGGEAWLGTPIHM